MKTQTTLDTCELGKPIAVSINTCGQIVTLFENGYIRTLTHDGKPEEILGLTLFDPQGT